MARSLRVGIIGANARGGWAGDAHVPAVQGLAGLELAAVATSRQKTADEAAHAFAVPKAYASGFALIDDPAIDLVTVATRVPDHRALVLAALAAGKHVYSEWPLGRGSAESNEMARAASDAGVHHAIGLQLRASPAVRAARECLVSGAIGRLLSISAFSSTAGFGPNVAVPFVYLEDPAAFANLVTIQGMHTLDLVTALGGMPTDLSALTSRQFPEIRTGDDGERRQRDTFDHLLVQGRFEGGGPFTMEVAGGRKADTPFWLDLVGERRIVAAGRWRAARSAIGTRRSAQRRRTRAGAGRRVGGAARCGGERSRRLRGASRRHRQRHDDGAGVRPRRPADAHGRGGVSFVARTPLDRRQGVGGMRDIFAS